MTRTPPAELVDDARARAASALPTRHARYAPIAEYALIGDCHGTALVHCTGSIDWACIPRFDAGSVFARLLDADHGGSFGLCARDLVSVTRRYVPNTMVLETTFVTATGTARLLDCFSMRRGGSKEPHRQILRVVEGVLGTVHFDVCVTPRFDYGALRPWLRRFRHGVYTAVGGDDALIFTSGCDLEVDRDGATLRGTFEVRRNGRMRFSVTWEPAHEMRPRRLDPRTIDRRMRETRSWWRRWVARGGYGGPYRDEVTRSALVLKTLTTAPTGSIIAAPTTSLPEGLGGQRNWDYRYCWIRDSAFSVAALCAIGHHEVAAGFMRFIEHATAGHAQDMQIMYGCYGERRLIENELKLEGYCASRPVRVGNGAAEQRQIDVYGELLNTAFIWAGEGNRLRKQDWRFLRSIVEGARSAWREPDCGFWEVRGEPQHFVHSKVMCWVALDRGIQMAKASCFDCDLAAWERTRDEIRAAVESQGVDPERNCFVQSFGSKALDASLLVLPIVGFVDANDPRMLRTVEEIEKTLTVDGFVRRYRPEEVDDGVGGGEGAFLMCSFWLADVLAMQGRHADAQTLFRRLLTVANDVGLFGEEFDPRAKRLLGNFPQAFTHVSLILSAVALSSTTGPSAHPAEHEHRKRKFGSAYATAEAPRRRRAKHHRA